MPDFRRVSEPDPAAATVRIFLSDEGVQGLVQWPGLWTPRLSPGPWTSLSMKPKQALAAALAAQARGAAPYVVVQTEDEALWNRRWGKLV